MLNALRLAVPSRAVAADGVCGVERHETNAGARGSPRRVLQRQLERKPALSS